MKNESLGTISHFFQLLQKQGDPQAAKAIWARYFPRLLGLAKKILQDKGLAMSAEDTVQEAFMNFFQRVSAGKYESLDRDDLWNILSLITTHRSRKLIIRESAQKRGAGKVRAESQLAVDDSTRFQLHDALDNRPTAEWDVVCSEMLLQLSDDLREVAMMRLAGYTNVQISEGLSCSLRSVERRLRIIRMTWQDQ